MYLAVGERVELDDKRVVAMGPRRVILGQQVAHGAEPAAMPHGGDVPAGTHLGVALVALCHAGGNDAERALLAVVAHDDLAALEGPHLDGAALAVAGVPEVASLLRVGSQMGGEVGQPRVHAVAVEPPHPCRLALIAAGDAAQQLGDVQVMQLPDEFAVPGPGVVHRVDKQAVDVHVVNPGVLSAAGLLGRLDALDAAARDEKLLQGAAVELVKFVVDAALRRDRRGLVMLDVLAAEAPHDGLDQLADQVVGDAFTALIGHVFALGHHPSRVVLDQVAPLVTIGEPLVAEPGLAQARCIHPRLVGRVQHPVVSFLVSWCFHGDNGL